MHRTGEFHVRPGQIVISGSMSACQRAVEVAEAAGCKASVLKVAGAFHSPLMQSAADRMARELERVAFHPPAVPVYSNVTAQPHGDPASIKRLLVDPDRFAGAVGADQPDAAGG